MSSNPIPLFTTPQEVVLWIDNHAANFKKRHHILYKLSILAVIYSLVVFFFPKTLNYSFMIYGGILVIIAGATVKMASHERYYSRIRIWFSLLKVIVGASFVLQFFSIMVNLFTLITDIPIAETLSSSSKFTLAGLFLIGHGLMDFYYFKTNAKSKELYRLFKEYEKQKSEFAYYLATAKVFYDGVMFNYRPDLNAVDKEPVKPAFNAEEYKAKRLAEIETQDTSLNFNEKLSEQADNIQKSMENAENIVQINQDAKKAALEEKRKAILKNL